MANKVSPIELAEQAKRKYKDGDYPAAVESFAAAANAYADSGDSLMAAEMKNNQAVALMMDKKVEAALETSQGTEDVFAQAGDDRRRGMALANQASALAGLRRYEEAILSYCCAGEALQRAGEEELRFKVMQLLSVLYLRRLKVMDAIISLQSGLATLENPTPKQRFLKKLLFFRI
jgi:tetratricopeptide (TPR) repeat protein